MSTTPISNEQPYLALTDLVMLQGSFPAHDPDGVWNGDYTLGMMRLFAGNFAWRGTAIADGTLLPLVGKLI